jgi:hypothetical protein
MYCTAVQYMQNNHYYMYLVPDKKEKKTTTKNRYKFDVCKL